jgi:hypothetical protein
MSTLTLTFKHASLLWIDHNQILNDALTEKEAKAIYFIGKIISAYEFCQQ